MDGVCSMQSGGEGVWQRSVPTKRIGPAAFSIDVAQDRHCAGVITDSGVKWHPLLGFQT